jgi:phospholipid/cholesterol/gamma-HCH transport system ATP-binding protein
MTLAENVAMGLKRIPGLSAAEIDERVDEALGLVDLRGSEGKYPSELSGGMRKRAGVARAVALRPSYLLYDEPTTGLDPLTVTMVNRLILKMRDELDVTSLIITHDMDSARSVSNRIALLHGGRVRWEGDAGELDVAEDPVVRGFVEGRPELMEEAS